jgi:hypothetical protein
LSDCLTECLEFRLLSGLKQEEEKLEEVN